MSIGDFVKKKREEAGLRLKGMEKVRTEGGGSYWRESPRSLERRSYSEHKREYMERAAHDRGAARARKEVDRFKNRKTFGEMAFSGFQGLVKNNMPRQPARRSGRGSRRRDGKTAFNTDIFEMPKHGIFGSEPSRRPTRRRKGRTIIIHT